MPFFSLQDRLEMALFVGRYVSCMIMFILGLKAPGILRMEFDDEVDYMRLVPPRVSNLPLLQEIKTDTRTHKLPTSFSTSQRTLDAVQCQIGYVHNKVMKLLRAKVFISTCLFLELCTMGQISHVVRVVVQKN